MVIEDELRELMTERSANPLPAQDRAVRVRRRIVRRQRARTALAATAMAMVVAMVVAVGAVVGAVVGWPGLAARQTSGDPGLGERLLPRYANGHLLRGAAGAPVTPDRTALTFTFTLTAWDLDLGFTCRTSQPAQLHVVLRHSRRWGYTRTCDPDGGVSLLPETRRPDPDIERGWRDRDVHLGQRVMVIARIKPEIDGAEAGSVTGAMAVGLYGWVPFEEYPLPPRPANFTGLDGWQGGVACGVPDAGPLLAVDARTVQMSNHTFTVSGLTMPHALGLNLVSVAPGTLRFLVNGAEVDQQSTWDYKGKAVCRRLNLPGLAPGAPFSLTIVAEHFTEPGWLVRLVELPG